MTQLPLIKTKEGASTQYNRYDLISYFIKCLRLGMKEEVLTTFWVMRDQGMSELYIGKKLAQFAVEDAVGTEAITYAYATYNLVKEFRSEENALSRLMLFLCDAPKMWETKEEHFWELRRIQIREKTKVLLSNSKRPLGLPTWTFDKYSASGKQKLRAGKNIDRRFSGVYEGSGLYMRANYLLRGHINPMETTPESAYSPHLLRCKDEELTVDGYLEKYGISPAEFLNVNATL